MIDKSKEFRSYGYIYVTIDMVTGLQYVGQRKGKFNPNYYGSGKIIKRYVKKYGKSRFKLKPADLAFSKEEINELEILWIKDLDCIWPKGFNLTPGGSGQGFHHPPEVIAKMIGPRVPRETRKCQCSLSCTEMFICKVSSKQVFCRKHRSKQKRTLDTVRKSVESKRQKALERGYYISDVGRQNMSIASKGKPKSEKHKENISKGLTGKPKSAEHNKKNSLSHKGIIHKDGCMCISCVSKRGEYVHKENCKCISCKTHRGEYKPVGMRGKHHTLETKEIARQKNLGKIRTKESIQKSIIANTGRVWMHNDLVGAFVKKDDIQEYIGKGFAFGRLKRILNEKYRI